MDLLTGLILPQMRFILYRGEELLVYQGNCGGEPWGAATIFELCCFIYINCYINCGSYLGRASRFMPIS